MYWYTRISLYVCVYVCVCAYQCHFCLYVQMSLCYVQMSLCYVQRSLCTYIHLSRTHVCCICAICNIFLHMHSIFCTLSYNNILVPMFVVYHTTLLNKVYLILLYPHRHVFACGFTFTRKDASANHVISTPILIHIYNKCFSKLYWLLTLAFCASLSVQPNIHLLPHMKFVVKVCGNGCSNFAT